MTTDLSAYFAENNPRYHAAFREFMGYGKPNLTPVEMKVVAIWWDKTLWAPGNSIPGITHDIIKRVYSDAALVNAYETLYGKRPHKTWTRRDLIAKVLVLNAAIEDAAARCKEKHNGS